MLSASREFNSRKLIFPKTLIILFPRSNESWVSAMLNDLERYRGWCSSGSLILWADHTCPEVFLSRDCCCCGSQDLHSPLDADSLFCSPWIHSSPKGGFLSPEVGWLPHSCLYLSNSPWIVFTDTKKWVLLVCCSPDLPKEKLNHQVHCTDLPCLQRRPVMIPTLSQVNFAPI